MSEADKMFEELGYEKIIENNIEILYKKERRLWNKEISFDLFEKHMRAEMSVGYSEPITMQELQAINMKVKEMRMDMMGYCGYFDIDTEYYEELEKLQEEYGEYCLQDCENCEYYEE